jgi:hypothetical protein
MFADASRCKQTQKEAALLPEYKYMKRPVYFMRMPHDLLSENRQNSCKYFMDGLLYR